ncbi:MAG TPA: hypothetical protein VH475_12555 [Tepidisphaeraceae bacterium]|jgi:hypothetical protein
MGVELPDQPIRIRVAHAARMGAAVGFLWMLVTACPLAATLHALGVPDVVQLLIILGSSVPAAALGMFGNLRLQRERERKLRGWCPRCGYDLRATPPGGRCPECGRRSPIRRGTGLG